MRSRFGFCVFFVRCILCRYHAYTVFCVYIKSSHQLMEVVVTMFYVCMPILVFSAQGVNCP